MTLPRLICAVLLVNGCVVPEKSLGQGETGEEGSGGTNGDDGPGSDDGTPPDDGATSMVGGTDDGATSMVGGTDDNATTAPEPGSTSAGSDGDSGDTGSGVCEIVESACELADQSKTPPIDCGDITTDDPLEAWEAAHACALDAATTMDAFKLVVDMQGIDSFPRRAFVGLVGFAYQMAQLDQDSGGFDPGPYPVHHRLCDQLVATPGCTPAVGDICLTCMGRTDGDVWCEP